MKTTVEIQDALFREVKRYAAAHDLTFREVVEAGLRGVVQTTGGKKQPFKLKDGAFKGKGMVKDFTWPEIRDLIYQGRGT
jgi:hypothetical protein